jgi:hypothetical protein
MEDICVHQSVFYIRSGTSFIANVPVWLSMTFLQYSDTSANEDNSFRDHIRLPKSSLAETWFPVGFYRKSFNSFWMLPTI